MFANLFTKLFNRKHRPIETRNRNRVRLDMERLEDRTTPSGIDLYAPGSSTVPDDKAQFGDAIFAQSDLANAVTGTGVFKPFLRLQANNQEQGINTSAKTVEFDTKAGIWTHAIQLQTLGVVNVGNGTFYEFQLDLNEPVGGGGKFADISLDRFEIYVANTSALTYAQLKAGVDGAKLVYDMDALLPAEDTWLNLHYTTVGSGSGRGDLKAYIGTNLFASYSPGSYLYLFNRNGDHIKSQDGFEEWKAFIGLDPATKEGYKFNDLNADGIWQLGADGLPNTDDAGEEPTIANWTIHLYGTDVLGNPVHQTTDTNADGLYRFTVLPGQYTVAEELRPGWTQSFPGAGPGIVSTSGHTDGGTFTPAPLGYAIVLTDGEIDTGNNFGNWTTAKKSGIKFEDLDADGSAREQGEPGLPDWTIYVDYDNDGVRDLNEPFDVTDETGAYLIEGIKPGTWYVREEPKEDWYNSYPALGYHYETFVSGGNYPNNDFGNYQYASKSGYKFNDLNADGVWQQDVEPPIEGWQVHLYGKDGSGADVHEVAYTDDTGKYYFSVKPGIYTVAEELPETWYQSYPKAGTGIVDTSGHTDGGTFTPAPLGYAITLTSGYDDTDNNFGNYQYATKSGVKFADVNGDGVRQPDGNETDADGNPAPISQDNHDGVYTRAIDGDDEVLLSGWEIRAYADTNGNGVLDKAEYDLGPAATDTTDINGYYSFALKPGKYIVVEVFAGHPSFTQQTFPFDVVLAKEVADLFDPLSDVFDPDLEPLGRFGYAITLTSGYNDTDNDFGNFPSPESFIISGSKFLDQTGNGLTDDDVPWVSPLEPVTISLFFDSNHNNVFDADDELATNENLTGDVGGYDVFLNLTPDAQVQTDPLNAEYEFELDFLVSDLVTNYKFFVAETEPDGYVQTWPVSVYYTVTVHQDGTRTSDGPDSAATVKLDFANAPDGEGKTPGFWKTNATNWGAVAWTDPIDPTDLVNSLFVIPDGAFESLRTQTLLTALSAEDRTDGGNPFNAAENMLRQAVAAALNSIHPEIEYPLDFSAVQALVNSAFATGTADAFNAVKAILESYNTLEGGIDQHNNPI